LREAEAEAYSHHCADAVWWTAAELVHVLLGKKKRIRNPTFIHKEEKEQGIKKNSSLLCQFYKKTIGTS